MKGDIKHQGIVEEVGEECVKVRIVQTSACAQCQAAGHCSASESKVKMVDVHTTAVDGSLNKGDSVTVVATSDTGLFAVILCAVIPLLLIITVLSITLMVTGNEAVAALGGIASLIPYYIILYLLRDKIGRRVAFRLENH